jgi:hypothetical protein
MLESSQSADISCVTKKDAWVCLLLFIVLLYNPFLAAQGSSGALSVGHPASYRATVASSELLKSENPESSKTIAIADGDLLGGFTLLQPQLQTSAGRGDTDDLHTADPFLSGNLWFRPPPTA